MQRPNLTKCSPEILRYLEHLESELARFKESPYLSSYLACWTTIENWNLQLSENEINILNPEQKQVFEMSHKFLTEQRPYIEQLEYLKGLMSPEEKKELEVQLATKKMNIAEKIAVRNGKPNI